VGNLNEMAISIAGTATLSICESLIALSDLRVIGEWETLAVLEDAAATHRNAALLSPNPDVHRAAAALIEQIAEGRKLARKQ